MMNLTGNYDEILEKKLKEDLDWLREEFDLLFRSKKEGYSKQDKKIASEILEKVIENTNIYNNPDLVSVLSLTLQNIEKSYPQLF